MTQPTPPRSLVAPSWRLLAPLLAALAALAACGDDPASTRDTDTPDTPDTTDTNDTGDTGQGDDTSADAEDTDGGDDTDSADAPDNDDTEDAADTDDTDDTDGGPLGPELTVERHGARLYGAVIQLSVTDGPDGRALWLGTRANVEPMEQRLRGGLVRYDLDTGAVLRLEDELPLEDYGEFGPYQPGTFGPAPTAGVQRDGERYVAVARTGLLALEGGAVTPFEVTYQGVAVVPIQLAIARDGLRPVAWMTSDIGLLRLDEDTFAVEAVLEGKDLEVPGDGVDEGEGQIRYGDFGKLAVDPDTGAVFASYFATNGTSRLVRVGVDGAVAQWAPGAGALPSGRVGDLVWSESRGGVYAALGSWSANQGGVVFWDGVTATEVVREGALGAAHGGEVAAFGAQILALDDAHGRLAVGGQLQSGFSGTKGGGLALVDLTSTPPRVLGLRDKRSVLVHWHAQHLAFDPVRGRLFAVMSDLCSEYKLRARGLLAFRFTADGAVELERPILSGVRALALSEEDLVLGLRDDNGGLACDSMPIQTGLGRAFADGSLGLIEVLSTSGDGITPDPGVTALDLKDGALALGTYRDGFMLGALAGDREHLPDAEGFVANPALIGPSLFLEDALVAEADGAPAIWLAGRTSHSPGDPPQLADRGPRGAALVEVRDNALGAVTHFVRASEDAEDVTGLPSSDVRDLSLEPDGSVLAACAAERVDLPYDRMETPIFEDDGAPRLGGLARLVPGPTPRVDVLAGPDVMPDPRAVTHDAEGRIVVADASRGILRQAASPISSHLVFEVLDLPGYPKTTVPQAVWAGADGDLAVAHSKGLWVRLGGRVLVLDDVGFGWALLAHAGGLAAGTDEGLVIIRPEGVTGPTLPAPLVGAEPPFSSE